MIRPTPPVPLQWGRGYAAEVAEPDVDPLLEPDVGGATEPDGGVPDSKRDPLPMSGQFLVEPDPEPVPEFPVVVDAVAPTASTLRRRICMVVLPFRVRGAPAPCEPVADVALRI